MQNSKLTKNFDLFTRWLNCERVARRLQDKDGVDVGGNNVIFRWNLFMEFKIWSSPSDFHNTAEILDKLKVEPMR